MKYYYDVIWHDGKFSNFDSRHAGSTPIEYCCKALEDSWYAMRISLEVGRDSNPKSPPSLTMPGLNNVYVLRCCPFCTEKVKVVKQRDIDLIDKDFTFSAHTWVDRKTRETIYEPTYS